MTVIDFPANPLSPINYSLVTWLDQNGKAWGWNANHSTWEPQPAYDDYEEIDEWVRNPAWIDMPLIAETDQKFQGIIAIAGDDNDRATIHCYGTSMPSYVVDWGDGNVETVTNNVLAVHYYNFADLSADTEFVLHDGPTVRQALVTVTPTSNNLNRLYLNSPASSEWPPEIRRWLHVSVNLPYLEQNYMCIADNYNVNAPYLEQVNFGVVGLTSFYGPFYNLPGLREITFKDTSNVVEMRQAFTGCSSLQRVPMIDTSNVTSFYQCFYYASSLKKVPQWDTSSATSVQYMFAGCGSLKRVPILNVTGATDFSAVFSSCSSLKEPPMWDTSNVTTFTQCFHSAGIKRMAPWDTSSAISMAEMFRNCSYLETVPLLDMSQNTTLYLTFSACGLLREVPLFNTTGVLNTNSCFSYGCQTTIPAWDLSSVQNAVNMFNSSPRISFIPEFSLPSCTDATSMFDGVYGIKKLSLPDFSGSSLGFWRTTMKTGALVDFFNSLPTVTGTHNLNMTAGTYTSSLTSGQIAIVTSKGWTLNL